MKFRDFIRESGFKILSLARLTQAECALTLYVLNTAVSGLDQLITTDAELGLAIGMSEREVFEALRRLSDRGIIRTAYGDSASSSKRASYCLSFQFDMSRWQLDFDTNVNSRDAIIFPFRRQGRANLQVLPGQRRAPSDRDIGSGREAPPETWRRVLDSFTRLRDLSDEETSRAAEAAQILTETHPVDQILLMIRHFATRIPTLSLLASSWQHYLELYESEVQKIDILDARQKHVELDDRLRKHADDTIAKQEDLELTNEERTVLQILSSHRHPRRQLFWAYQLRSRYPRLESFFAANIELMLPVTSSGSVVKRNPEE